MLQHQDLVQLHAARKRAGNPRCFPAFVRKLSGFSVPSKANAAAFDQAVAEGPGN